MSVLKRAAAWLAERSHRPAAIFLGTAVAVLILELALRASMPHLAHVPPISDVLFLAPDRVVGWKHPPNFQYVWNGRNPYCVEFSVPVSINRTGFRDREWTQEKQPGTKRIALIGDSFVEALQVALEDTIPRQLETRLAARLKVPVETMNAGVSNYSAAQYLMVYDEYIKPFRPDYVVIVAAYQNFLRTMQPDLSSWLHDVYSLNIRPTFNLDDAGNLVYVPARDYDRYVAEANALVEGDYGADRAKPMRRLPSPLVLTNFALHVLSRNIHPSEILQRRRVTEFPDAPLNYRIIEELNRHVRADGGTLVFADAFGYLDGYGGVSGSQVLVPRNQALIRKLGAGYVDLSAALQRAPTSPQYPCDLHFNTTGNHVVAETLAVWFARVLPAAGSGLP